MRLAQTWSVRDALKQCVLSTSFLLCVCLVSGIKHYTNVYEHTDATVVWRLTALFNCCAFSLRLCKYLHARLLYDLADAICKIVKNLRGTSTQRCMSLGHLYLCLVCGVHTDNALYNYTYLLANTCDFGCTSVKLVKKDGRVTCSVVSVLSDILQFGKCLHELICASHSCDL